MLCEASNQNKSGNLILSTKFICTWGECPENIVFSTIEKLKKIKVLSVICADFAQNPNGTCAEFVPQTKTKTKTKKENTIVQIEFERVSFDFLKIYKEFPKKMGKQKGLAKLMRTVKTQQDFDNCLTAVINYKKYTKDKEPQYVKLFSTFAGEWEEWVNPDKSIFDNQRVVKIDFEEIYKES